MVNHVKAEVTRRNLTFTPRSARTEDTDANSEFEVIVTNESRDFASFQLELDTPGVNTEAIDEWYRIEPKVCAKKPPGASTTFHVEITRSPLPVYETTIDLWLRVFSVERHNLFATQKLNLTITKAKQFLALVLPIQTFKAAPGDRLDIPVLLYNRSARAFAVTVACEGLEAWLNPSYEQKVRVDPSDPAKVIFSCYIPDDPDLLSQRHPFTIQAFPEVRGPLPPAEEGIVEVLPLGMVEFNCTPKLRQIPAQRRSPDSDSMAATYQIELKNTNHLPQRIKITASERAQQRCQLVLPSSDILTPGETKLMVLGSKKKRPWFGLKRRLRFNAQAEVLDPIASDRSTRVRAVPSYHTLELQLRPIISLWLLLAGGLLLLALLILQWLLRPHHQGPVNSVRIDGNASTVFSGSSDQTILRWQVDNNLWQRITHYLKFEDAITPKVGKAIRVIRLNPTDNNTLAAGLENGAIQLWDVLGNQVEKRLFEQNDRVFDLVFTDDSRYLFSGHGSGQVRQWDLTRDSHKSIRRIVPQSPNFSLAALALYQESLNSSWIILAGQFNRLMLWDWRNRSIYTVQPTKLKLDDDLALGFAPIEGQYHYIESLTIANHILVTADNQGVIATWDLANRGCWPQPESTIQVLEVAQRDGGETRKPLSVGECHIPILDRWSDGHAGKAVRSVAITEDGAYLASVGDDGRTKLWWLDGGVRSPRWKQGKVLAHPGKSHSVDIQLSNSSGYIFVASDAPQYRVRLYREPIKP